MSWEMASLLLSMLTGAGKEGGEEAAAAVVVVCDRLLAQGEEKEGGERDNHDEGKGKDGVRGVRGQEVVEGAAQDLCAYMQRWFGRAFREERRRQRDREHVDTHAHEGWTLSARQQTHVRVRW